MKKERKALHRNRPVAVILGLLWFTVCFATLATILFVNSIQIRYFPVGSVIAIATTLIAFIAFGYMTLRLYAFVRDLWRGVEVKAV
jgi:Mg/Co/Ni transporter MgtE